MSRVFTGPLALSGFCLGWLCLATSNMGCTPVGSDGPADAGATPDDPKDGGAEATPDAGRADAGVEAPDDGGAPSEDGGGGGGGGACDGKCGELVYDACTCGADDPCGWQSDGYCDDTCADFGATFDDTEDCAGAETAVGSACDTDADCDAQTRCYALYPDQPKSCVTTCTGTGPCPAALGQTGACVAVDGPDICVVSAPSQGLCGSAATARCAPGLACERLGLDFGKCVRACNPVAPSTCEATGWAGGPACGCADGEVCSMTTELAASFEQTDGTCAAPSGVGDGCGWDAANLRWNLCGPGQYCGWDPSDVFSSGTCQPDPGVVGAPCAVDTDCISGKCRVTDGICVRATDFVGTEAVFELTANVGTGALANDALITEVAASVSSDHPFFDVTTAYVHVDGAGDVQAILIPVTNTDTRGYCGVDWNSVLLWDTDGGYVGAVTNGRVVGATAALSPTGGRVGGCLAVGQTGYFVGWAPFPFDASVQSVSISFDVSFDAVPVGPHLSVALDAFEATTDHLWVDIANNASSALSYDPFTPSYAIFFDATARPVYAVPLSSYWDVIGPNDVGRISNTSVAFEGATERATVFLAFE